MSIIILTRMPSPLYEVGEYDEEIPQSHNADQPKAHSNETQERQLKQSNQLSLSLSLSSSLR